MNMKKNNLNKNDLNKNDLNKNNLNKNSLKKNGLTKSSLSKNIPIITALLMLTIALSGCGKQSTIKVITEEKFYPAPDEVTGGLEEQGFQVDSFDNFEELGIEVTRIKAVNGNDYLDMCYNVSSEHDLDAIIEYYMANYEKYNLVSDTSTVFCYSSESVVESAGLQ